MGNTTQLNLVTEGSQSISEEIHNLSRQSTIHSHNNTHHLGNRPDQTQDNLNVPVIDEVDESRNDQNPDDDKSMTTMSASQMCYIQRSGTMGDNLDASKDSRIQPEHVRNYSSTGLSQNHTMQVDNML